MKRYTITALLTLCVTMAFGQLPRLVIVPSENWCEKHGYIQKYDNQGTIEEIPDYQKALRENSELNLVITAIGSILEDRGYTRTDLMQTMTTNNNRNALRHAQQSKTSGASVAESPKDKIMRAMSNADILLNVSWTLNQTGPKRSLTCILSAIDIYTNKPVAETKGTGAPSFSSELPILLEEAVIGQMDIFCAKLQTHFEGLITNGREVAISVSVFDNGSGVDLESEFDGQELTEIITDWMDQNTVNHRYTIVGGTEKYLEFTQVRIPFYNPNGSGSKMNAYDFTSQLRKFLRSAPYNLQSKLDRGQPGWCELIIGEK